jgi:hypothetical protein
MPCGTGSALGPRRGPTPATAAPRRVCRRRGVWRPRRPWRGRGGPARAPPGGPRQGGQGTGGMAMTGDGGGGERGSRTPLGWPCRAQPRSGGIGGHDGFTRSWRAGWPAAGPGCGPGRARKARAGMTGGGSPGRSRCTPQGAAGCWSGGACAPPTSGQPMGAWLPTTPRWRRWCRWGQPAGPWPSAGQPPRAQVVGSRTRSGAGRGGSGLARWRWGPEPS